MQWPQNRCSHAATCVSDSTFVVIGGRNLSFTQSDLWLCDTVTMLWKKVSMTYNVLVCVCMRNNLVKSIAPKVLMPPVLVGRAQRGHIRYNIKQQMSREGQSRCRRLQGICASCRLIALMFSQLPLSCKANFLTITKRNFLNTTRHAWRQLVDKASSS